MRLAKVFEDSGLEFRAVCLGCGGTIPIGEKVADLDGPAFKAYYHRICAANFGLPIDHTQYDLDLVVALKSTPRVIAEYRAFADIDWRKMK